MPNLPELSFDWSNQFYQSLLEHQQNYSTERKKNPCDITFLNKETAAGLDNLKLFLQPYLVEEMGLVSHRQYHQLGLSPLSNLFGIKFTIFYGPVLIREYPEAGSSYNLEFEVFPNESELVTKVRFQPRGSKTQELLVLQDAVLDRKLSSDESYRGYSLKEVLAHFPNVFNYFEEINVKRFSSVIEVLDLLEKAKDKCGPQLYKLALARNGIRERLAAGALPGTEAATQKKSLEVECQHYFDALKELCCY